MVCENGPISLILNRHRENARVMAFYIHLGPYGWCSSLWKIYRNAAPSPFYSSFVSSLPLSSLHSFFYCVQIYGRTSVEDARARNHTHRCWTTTCESFANNPKPVLAAQHRHIYEYIYSHENYNDNHNNKNHCMSASIYISIRYLSYLEK